MFTTVSEFAHHILQSGSLQEKLRKPIQADGKPLEFDVGPPIFVDLPTRDDVLLMREGNERLPKLKVLRDVHARALCLERFCGHELQAIELFAWALLAFPLAPTPLRRGFLAALVEEQTHLGLYRERLFAHDSDLGQHALSNYFWKLMPAVRAHAQPEHAFLATVGLTLEQANLDFSLLYRDAFAEVDDKESAAVMNQVHLDEVGHVRLAAVWLPKLTEQPLLEAYQKSIPFPLSAARAKARRFDVASRKKSGLDDAFIEFVRRARPYEKPEQASSASLLSLRPNFGGEEYRGGVSTKAEQATETLRCAFAHLFQNPQWAPPRQGAAQPASGMTIHEAFSAPFESNAYSWLPTHGKVAWWPTLPGEVGPGKEILEAVHDKGFAASFPDEEFAHQPLIHVLSPENCSPENVEHLIRQWPDWLKKEALLKPRFSSSGRGQIRIDCHTLTEKNARRLRSVSRKAGMILEPKFLLAAEFSSQWFIEESGQIHFLGSTEQLVSPRGTPLGNQGWVHFCDGKKTLSSGQSFDDTFIRRTRRIVEAARERGFFGPCGVDGFTYSDDTGALKLRSVSEFNARFTAGWVGLGVLERALATLSPQEKRGATFRWKFLHAIDDDVREPCPFPVGQGGLWLVPTPST